MKLSVNITILVVVLSFFSIKSCTDFDHLPHARVIVPVADAVMRRLGSCSQQLYYQLPYAEVAEPEAEICERGYQLLFNEQVGIIDQQGDEMCVCVPHIYYQPARNEKPLSTYWVLSSSIMPIQELQKANVDITLFPKAKHIYSPELVTNELVLKYPWTYNGITYSVGTRFAIDSLSAGQASIWVFNPQSKQWDSARIDKQFYVTPEIRSLEDSITLMLEIMRLWAHHPHGVIPYVWGGASFTHLVPDNEFIIKRSQGIMVYEREQSTYPKTGFDCSCFISRAAQICNLPYWWGDSVTVHLHAMPVTKKNGIRNGDIIWIPGHVLMVSDVKQGIIIEARGYGSGYGKVHELHLAKFFDGISTFDELLSAYEQQAPLSVLNRAGQIRAIYKQFCICDLRESLGS